MQMNVQNYYTLACFTKIEAVSIADSLCRTLYGRGKGTHNRNVLPMKLKCNSALPALHPRNLRERPRVSRRRIRTSRGFSARKGEVFVGPGMRCEGGLWDGLRIREWSGRAGAATRHVAPHARKGWLPSYERVGPGLFAYFNLTVKSRAQR